MKNKKLISLIRNHVHLTEDEFARYLDRSLPAEVLPIVEAHLRICFDCASEINTAIDAIGFPLAKLPLPPDPASMLVMEETECNIVSKEVFQSDGGIMRRLK